MMNDLPAPLSLWSATVQMPSHLALDGDLDVDVCVVGGGIAGLTAAYLLSREGTQVALLEARELGEGETSHTTAHIAVPDDRYWYIEQAHGTGDARLIAESFAAAIDLVERIVRTENIDCDFERLEGYLISCAAHPESALQREYAAARRAGVDVERAMQVPFGHFPPQPCLRFAQQAQFHPLRYLAALARAVEDSSGVIHTHTPVTSIEEDPGGVTVHTDKHKVRARAAVMATNTPVNDRVAIHTKQTAWQSYVVAASVPAGLLPHILLWDDADSYHYVRLAPGGDRHELLIAGGADHKSGQESQPQLHYQAVETWLRENFPMAGPVKYRWSGQVMEPLDGIAYLGRNPGDREIYVITGDSGNGMTHACIGAALVTDLIARRSNRWEQIYSPSRKALKEALQYLRGQTNIAGQYVEWLSAGDAASAQQLGPGEGAVVRSGLKKLAAYRDESGELHVRSAACPHLGCLVQWNTVEKTWDCPCHGSRFDARGQVIHGPAVSGLAALEIGTPEERRALR